ncbi:MAG: ATP phosphoribosyltransferase regulatory subunit [Gammaproteobacteria bacterium]|nr:ATP phosphoribosyltransferase regulatory subunit [Gammaproteobacteria bacterium]
MMVQDRWILPQGIEELLPQQASKMETLRRRVVDLYASWGYELVVPPLMEYLESLLVGTGRELDLSTFKLVDQLNGRTMGIRADITPQVARIDAHRLQREVPTRLCYLGSVLHTRGEGLAGSRSPLQLGAELYGHAGVESDVEIIALMLKTLELAGIKSLHLDLGHVGLFRGLAAEAELNEEQEAHLFEMFQRKAKPEIETFLEGISLSSDHRDMLMALVNLNGDASVLAQARGALATAGNEVQQALHYLQATAERLQQSQPELTLHFDLAELRGYHYHTGVVFSAYAMGYSQEIARGGRYDDIGRAFGRARPATGFSTDLKTLVSLSSTVAEQSVKIFAPAGDDSNLWETIQELRNSGQTVIRALPGQSGSAADMGCERKLVFNNEFWTVVDA